jgi:hypothetical protein
MPDVLSVVKILIAFAVVVSDRAHPRIIRSSCCFWFAVLLFANNAAPSMTEHSVVVAFLGRKALYPLQILSVRTRVPMVALLAMMVTICWVQAVSPVIANTFLSRVSRCASMYSPVILRVTCERHDAKGGNDRNEK